MHHLAAQTDDGLEVQHQPLGPQQFGKIVGDQRQPRIGLHHRRIAGADHRQAAVHQMLAPPVGADIDELLQRHRAGEDAHDQQRGGLVQQRGAGCRQLLAVRKGNRQQPLQGHDHAAAGQPFWPGVRMRRRLGAQAQPLVAP
ncbi:hypothetical protein D3C86_1787140 [compost metagenome]